MSERTTTDQPDQPQPDQDGLRLEMETVLDVNRLRYTCWVTIDGTDRMRLTASLAAAWSNDALMLAAHARYQAAVLAQIRDLGLDPDLGLDRDAPQPGASDPRGTTAAVQAMKHLRAQLPRPVRLGRYTLAPEVSAITGGPLVAIVRDGEVLTHWSAAEAEEHALAVLAMLRTAACDTEYLRWLVNTIGLDVPRATHVIGHLTQHQEWLQEHTTLRLPSPLAGPAQDDRDQQGSGS